MLLLFLCCCSSAHLFILVINMIDSPKSSHSTYCSVTLSQKRRTCHAFVQNIHAHRFKVKELFFCFLCATSEGTEIHQGRDIWRSDRSLEINQVNVLPVVFSTAGKNFCLPRQGVRVIAKKKLLECTFSTILRDGANWNIIITTIIIRKALNLSCKSCFGLILCVCLWQQQVHTHIHGRWCIFPARFWTEKSDL